MSMPEQASGKLVAAREALDRGAWPEARELFEAALAEEESADAWEGLGWAGWWLSDEELTFRARERAYKAFRAAGDPLGAGRVALWIAADYREFRGEATVGQGWLERAHRLLDDLPECAEHGWLALTEVSFVLNADPDAAPALALARFGARLGRELGVADLEAVGLAQEGIALVGKGDVAEGMRLLDEGSAIAAAEDLHLPLSRGWAMCCMISACEGVGDFPRAAQWCDATREFTDRWGGRHMLGLCRSAYGRVLATRGDWPAADREMTAAVQDLEAARPGMAGGGLARLGDLRARQGRTEEARELFERAGSGGLVGLGQLALDADDPGAAADAADRVLRRFPEAGVLDRLPALELLVRARARLGELDAATEAVAELERSASLLGTTYLRGRSRLVAGELAAARGDHEDARRACEDAVDDFEEVAAPYDAALSRLELARALAALGHTDRSEREAAAARETFAALGAARDATRAMWPLPDSGNGAAGPASLSEVTPRELEILRLVARGMSDAEIAEELVLSPHTVHRHVANVRTKLGLGSRAAAVAYAAREGLL
jgi:DNA-binding CsgD family transcriptional regulator/tetratricopeptide (TPR) repeat protein